MEVLPGCDRNCERYYALPDLRERQLQICGYL